MFVLANPDILVGMARDFPESWLAPAEWHAISMLDDQNMNLHERRIRHFFLD